VILNIAASVGFKRLRRKEPGGICDGITFVQCLSVLFLRGSCDGKGRCPPLQSTGSREVLVGFVGIVVGIAVVSNCGSAVYARLQPND